MRRRSAIIAMLFATISLAFGLGATAQARSTGPFGGDGASCVEAERSAAADVHRAALVITFGDAGATRRICVEFTESSITGLELLERSGSTIL